MKEKTATQIRVELMEKQRAYSMLAEHPHLQAEKIAKHYAAHAELSREILHILDLDPDMNSVTRKIVDYLINQIKTNHRADLGIDLEWRKE